MRIETHSDVSITHDNGLILFGLYEGDSSCAADDINGRDRSSAVRCCGTSSTKLVQNEETREGSLGKHIKARYFGARFRCGINPNEETELGHGPKGRKKTFDLFSLACN